MPLKGGDFRPLADAFAISYKEYFTKNKKNFKHIGDVEIYQCFQHGLMYFLLDRGEIIFVCKLEKFYGLPEAMMLDSVWLDKAYEGKKIFSKMLWFLRSREGFKQLVLGDNHSKDTFNLLKGGGLSNFNKEWFNSKTKETDKFDLHTMDHFYKTKDWKLILTSNKDGDDLTEEVKNDRFSFTTDLKYGFTKSSYDWQIQ